LAVMTPLKLRRAFSIAVTQEAHVIPDIAKDIFSLFPIYLFLINDVEFPLHPHMAQAAKDRTVKIKRPFFIRDKINGSYFA